jgi:type III pantothenate kinase
VNKIALSIGNSRYHWACFTDDLIVSTWDSPYLSDDNISSLMVGESLEPAIAAIFPPELQGISLKETPIYLASVVPIQTEIWQQYPQIKTIQLGDIPLHNLYPTLGIDRALAVLSAGENYGYPVLVIDGGTALTLTGVDGAKNLVGGAILPGLKLQLNTLGSGTAALPAIELPASLPPRWSNNTPDAIASGVLYTAIAGINNFIGDWWQHFPASKVVFTGGDGELIWRYLRSLFPAVEVECLTLDRHLIFKGIQAIHLSC